MKFRFGQVREFVHARGQALDNGRDDLSPDLMSGGLELFVSAVYAFETNAMAAVHPAAGNISG